MKKPVIICVDDESVVLTSLKEQIRKNTQGYDIETADNGQDVLDMIEELMANEIEITMVICDYIMPGMYGDEVLTKVHAILPETITVLLTGQATMEGVVNSLNNANLYRYIGKPWEEKDLALTIKEGIKSFVSEKTLKDQNQKLEAYNQELNIFTEAIVETLVAAIDTRDTTTAGHSKRLAEYSVKLAQAIDRTTEGKYKDFHFTPQQLKELYYAALLHDVGKIGVKEVILQKEFRLSEEKQVEIKHRFTFYKKCLEVKKISGEIKPEEIEILDKLMTELEFVLMICKRGYITEEEKEHLIHIASFGGEEEDGSIYRLLSAQELENLTVATGNLTAYEREMMNSHVEYTHSILSKIPWTSGLEMVPIIAASHHERLDGSGYNRGICGEELIVQTRILNILDVYEALTALDRPYRPPMTPEIAIQIIQEETNRGKFDKDIFDIFVTEKVYEQ